MKEFKIRKYRRDMRDYNTNNRYNFNLGPFIKSKRVTWAGSTYCDITSTEGEELTGTSADEGPSSREHYGKAAKGKARDIFFSNAPLQKGTPENLEFNFSSKHLSGEIDQVLNLGLNFVPTPDYNLCIDL